MGMIWQGLPYLLEFSYSGWIGRLEWIGIEIEAFYFCDTSRVFFADAASQFFQRNPDPLHPDGSGFSSTHLRRTYAYVFRIK